MARAVVLAIPDRPAVPRAGADLDRDPNRGAAEAERLAARSLAVRAGSPATSSSRVEAAPNRAARLIPAWAAPSRSAVPGGPSLGPVRDPSSLRVATRAPNQPAAVAAAVAVAVAAAVAVAVAVAAGTPTPAPAAVGHRQLEPPVGPGAAREPTPPTGAARQGPGYVRRPRRAARYPRLRAAGPAGAPWNPDTVCNAPRRRR